MKPPKIGKVYHHAKHTGLHERISIRHKYDNQDLYSSGILSVFFGRSQRFKHGILCICHMYDYEWIYFRIRLPVVSQPSQ